MCFSIAFQTKKNCDSDSILPGVMESILGVRQNIF